jgi:hypothetical protein
LGYLVKIPLEDGDFVTLETTDGPDGPVTRSGRVPEAVTEVGRSLESYLGGIKSATAAMVSKLQDIDEGVEEVDIALGVKLSAKAGLVIANTSGEANFNITVRWKRPHPESARTISLPEPARDLTDNVT